MTQALIALALLFAPAWVIYRLTVDKLLPALRSRRCPRCGHRVGVGVMDCPSCGRDFRGD